jgi:hypothetical protein
MLILLQKVNKYPFLLHQTQFGEILGVKMMGIIIMAELFKGLKSEVHYNKPRYFTFNSKGYGVKPNSHADNLKAPLHRMDLKKSATV